MWHRGLKLHPVGGLPGDEFGFVVAPEQGRARFLFVYPYYGLEIHYFPLIGLYSRASASGIYLLNDDPFPLVY